MVTRTLVLCSSPDDRSWLEALQVHLAPLTHQGLAIWDDSQILAGQDPDLEAQRALDGAQAALLLVSPPFLSSPALVERRVPAILQAMRRRELLVLCLYLRASVVDQATYPCPVLSPAQPPQLRLTDLTGLNSPHQPIASLANAQQDVALAAAVNQLRTLLLGAPTGWAADESAPPSPLGPWALESSLGRSDLAMVFQARTELGQVAAIKVYRAGEDVAHERGRRARFLRGAEALRRLQEKGPHPNLVRYLDGPYDRDDGTLWYAMSLVPGPSLSRGIGQLLSLPLRDRLALFVGVCHGVAHAHSLAPPGRIFHRSLTPNNILIDTESSSRRLVVTDFDSARSETAESLTDSQGLTGHLNYVPPEQVAGWQGGPSWDRPDEEIRDLWSLGMVLHFVLTGSHALSRSTREAKRASKLRSEAPATVAELAQIIEWCLADLPHQRPQSVEELLARLTNLA